MATTLEKMDLGVGAASFATLIGMGIAHQTVYRPVPSHAPLPISTTLPKYFRLTSVIGMASSLYFAGRAVQHMIVNGKADTRNVCTALGGALALGSLVVACTAPTRVGLHLGLAAAEWATSAVGLGATAVYSRQFGWEMLVEAGFTALGFMGVRNIRVAHKAEQVKLAVSQAIDAEHAAVLAKSDGWMVGTKVRTSVSGGSFQVQGLDGVEKALRRFDAVVLPYDPNWDDRDFGLGAMLLRAVTRQDDRSKLLEEVVDSALKTLRAGERWDYHFDSRGVGTNWYKAHFEIENIPGSEGLFAISVSHRGRHDATTAFAKELSAPQKWLASEVDLILPRREKAGSRLGIDLDYVTRVLNPALEARGQARIDADGLAVRLFSPFNRECAVNFRLNEHFDLNLHVANVFNGPERIAIAGTYERFAVPTVRISGSKVTTPSLGTASDRQWPPTIEIAIRHRGGGTFDPAVRQQADSLVDAIARGFRSA